MLRITSISLCDGNHFYPMWCESILSLYTGNHFYPSGGIHFVRECIVLWKRIHKLVTVRRTLFGVSQRKFGQVRDFLCGIAGRK